MTTHIIKRLDQAALLTDPFKLKLVERFATEPRTTKQVADLMGEKAPKLYRHVDALIEAGLLVLIEEKPKRGTIERYYQTIAQRFELDPDLFQGSNAEQHLDESMQLVRQLFRDTEQEMTSLDLSEATAYAQEGLEPVFMRLTGEVTKAEYTLLRDKLMEWAQECESISIEDTKGGTISMRGLVTMYPLTDTNNIEQPTGDSE